MRIQWCKTSTAPRAHFLCPGLIGKQIIVNDLAEAVPQHSFMDGLFFTEEVFDQNINNILLGTELRHLFLNLFCSFCIWVSIQLDVHLILPNLIDQRQVLVDQNMLLISNFHICIVHQHPIVKGAKLLLLEVKLIRLNLIKQTIDTGLVGGLALVRSLIFCVNEEAGDSATGSSVNAFVPFWRTSRFVERFRIPLNPRFPDISVGE